jgi:hypothetical protein
MSELRSIELPFLSGPSGPSRESARPAPAEEPAPADEPGLEEDDVHLEEALDELERLRSDVVRILGD